jgi:hypothetical protein
MAHGERVSKHSKNDKRMKKGAKKVAKLLIFEEKIPKIGTRLTEDCALVPLPAAEEASQQRLSF